MTICINQRRSIGDLALCIPIGKLRGHAFTLLELVGVLAVAAILAAVLVPALITKANQTTAELEEETLENLAKGLKTAVALTKAIPTGTNWIPFLATNMGVAQSTILTNGWGSPRIYLINPDWTLPLPYSQSSTGTPEANVAEAKAIILSSITQTLTPPVTSGVAASAAAFDNIWNASEGSVPSGWPASWNGHGDELIIQRVNLRPLFKRVILNNNETSEAPYQIGAETNYVAGSNTRDAYFIQNTVLSLLDPADEVNRIQGTQILMSDSEFVFEGNYWRGNTLEGKTNRSIAELEATAESFMESETNVNALNGVTQQTMVEAMDRYLSNYYVWGSTYNFAKTGSAADTYQNLENAQNDIASISQDLVHNLEAPPSTYIFVFRITTSTPSAGGGGKKSARAIVTIKDSLGNLVQDAVVNGAFSGSFDESASASTDVNGEATFDTTQPPVKNPLGLFTVNSVTHESLLYDPTHNVETSAAY